MKRWLAVTGMLLTLGLIAGAGYWGYQSGQTELPATPTAPVTIAVTQGDVQRTVTAPGQLVGTRQEMLGMAVAGRLVELAVRPGTAVAAGDIIARHKPGRAVADDIPEHGARAEADHRLYRCVEHTNRRAEKRTAAIAGDA